MKQVGLNTPCQHGVSAWAPLTVPNSPDSYSNKSPTWSPPMNNYLKYGVKPRIIVWSVIISNCCNWIVFFFGGFSPPKNALGIGYAWLAGDKWKGRVFRANGVSKIPFLTGSDLDQHIFCANYNDQPAESNHPKYAGEKFVRESSPKSFRRIQLLEIFGQIWWDKVIQSFTKFKFGKLQATQMKVGP